MVFAINIRKQGDLTKGVNSLKRIHKKLPQMSSRAMMKFGKTLERDIKDSAIQSGIQNNTGHLLSRGIEYRQKPNGRVGKLFIVNYGVMLDSMKPHWVNILRRRKRLLRWALNSRNFKKPARKILTGKLDKYTIYVRPHPFIADGWRRARPKLRPIIKRELNNTLAISM